MGVQVKLWNPLRTRAIYLSASAVVIHYEEALYQVYGPKKPGFKAEDVTLGLGVSLRNVDTPLLHK